MAAQSRRACPDRHHSWAPAGSPIEPDCGPARRNFSRRRRTFIQVYHLRLQSNDFGVSARRSPGPFGAISRPCRDTQSCSKSPWIYRSSAPKNSDNYARASRWFHDPPRAICQRIRAAYVHSIILKFQTRARNLHNFEKLAKHYPNQKSRNWR